MMTMVMGLLGVALAKAPCATDASKAENTAEIKAMFDASEEDRLQRSADAEAVLARDEKRAKIMAKYDKKSWLCTPQDKWYAAWLMQQSDDIRVIERAYQLAIIAMKNNVDRGPWLVAYAFDHKRVLMGYRQSYGTQTRVDPVGRRCMIELEGDQTDADRAKYGVPSLEGLYRSVLDANGRTDDPPTLERMKRHSLICPPLAISKKDQKRVQGIR